jgi:mannose/cellobiose epimerase-like protein (N-acyl-D-glucosamine 2-epimerase family)
MIAGSAPVRAMGENRKGEDHAPASTSPTVVNELGGMTLSRLRDFHRSEIEGPYLAHWNKGGIDWQYGGFIPRFDETGKFTSDIKEMYYLGRGLWIFSYLYNRHGHRENHVKAARLCWEFMAKYGRDPQTGWWLSKVTRDGKPVEGPLDIYGDMYVILGLTEYYKAVDDKKLLDIAIETAHGINERIVSPSYQHLGAHKNGFEPGTKILGTWQHFLGSLTPLARATGDYGVGMMARMCVQNIMERHFSREYGVFFEYLDDEFKPFRPGGDPELRKISSWHSVQSAWMCMDEALRLNHRAMFMDACEMGRLTFEKCWREDDDGGLIGLDYPEQNVKDSRDSQAWERLDDALVLLLLAIEHTHAPWAVYWYDKVFAFGAKHPEKWNRNGLLHHPRRLFFSLEILDRMITRKGRVSNFLEG